MSADSSYERIRQAARDGYLEILKNATRKECNAPDEDGMTSTHWASYAGNLEALRIIVGRGGDPGKCDNFGNTALHCAAAYGHFSCVSFLVSFGANLWALDNQYHTAKEVAGLNNCESVVQFLDHVIAKQSALNTKVVQKMKEKALHEAEKRIKQFQKLQSKTVKLAEREEKQREKQRKKSLFVINSNQDVIYSDVNQNDSHIYDTLATVNSTNKSLITAYNSTISSNSSSVKFSDLVNSSVKSSKTGTARSKILSGVSRKVLIRKQNSSDTMKSTDTICRSVRSLVGIRRDDQIMYVPRFSSTSVTNLSAFDGYEDKGERHSNSRINLEDVFINDNAQHKSEHRTNTFNKNIKASIKNKLFKFNGKSISKNKSNGGPLYRTVSEPDFLFINQNNHSKTNNNKDGSLHTETASIFERPGFGSVSFRGKFTPESLFSTSHCFNTDSAGNSDDDDRDSGHDNSHGSSNRTSANKKFTSTQKQDEPISLTYRDHDSCTSDSIGSAGSLAQQDCLEDHYEPSESDRADCLLESKSIPVLLFLYAHGLKEYYDVFESEKIDVDALMLLTEDDLVSLGIPLGPRRKLVNAIQQRKYLFEKNAHVFETKL